MTPTRPINPQWLAGVQASVNSSPYFRLLSMRIVDLAPGACRVEIDLASKHLQPFGLVHGGAYSSLIDAAGFWACFTLLDEGAGLVSTEMKLNYLAPIQAGRMVGLGRCIKQGRRIGLGEARVEDQDGRLLAHGTVSTMPLGDLPLLGQAELPPKCID